MNKTLGFLLLCLAPMVFLECKEQAQTSDAKTQQLEVKKNTTAQKNDPAPVAKESPHPEPPKLDPKPTTLVQTTQDRTRQLRVVVENYRLQVTDGKTKASLNITASKLVKLIFSEDDRTIRVDYEWAGACAEEARSRTFNYAYLEARLENKKALAHHRKQRFEEAAEGFARAAALDPSYEAATTNLACALSMLGKPVQALETLDPLLRKEPVRIYLKILMDHDLESLSKQPAVSALKAHEPGTARLTNNVRKFEVAYSADKGLLATVGVSESWGSMTWEARLNIHEAKTGKRLFDQVLVEWGDTDPDDEGGGQIRFSSRKKVADRVESVNNFLRDFGFNPPENLEKGIIGEPLDSAWPNKAGFKQAMFALVLKDGVARVIKKNDILAKKEPASGQMLQRAFYIPDPPTVLYLWHIDEPEGCDIESDISGSDVIPII